MNAMRSRKRRRALYGGTIRMCVPRKVAMTQIDVWATKALAFWLERIQARAAMEFERMARELRQ